MRCNLRNSIYSELSCNAMISSALQENNWYQENQSENESLRARIREVEDENQELRAQNLIQNRTIIEMRNELVLMRIQMNEMADTSALLTERVRTLSQDGINNGGQIQGIDGNSGQITTPPLMAPPPVPPPMPMPLPLPPARIRISPRQVGAGEALTTPLGVSLSSPPRHRIKRDCSQGLYRPIRSPYRRVDTTEPGPSSPSSYMGSDRPNYFVGLRIIPQFHPSFVCSQNQSSTYSDSASDSSGSDENPQLFKKVKKQISDNENLVAKKHALPRDFELFKNVKNLHHPKVRPALLHNYNLSLPNTDSKFFFPLPWDKKTRGNPILPSTSGNENSTPNTNGTTDSQKQQEQSQPTQQQQQQQQPQDEQEQVQTQTPGFNPTRNIFKISDCVQYTFPTIHEGLHNNGIHSMMTSASPTSRLRKLKKNIPYLRPEEIKIFDVSKKATEDEEMSRFIKANDLKNIKTIDVNNESESLSSMEEAGRPFKSSTIFLGEVSSDFDQDGFQADESSNCMTSTENSLEKICISESNMERKH